MARLVPRVAFALLFSTWAGVVETTCEGDACPFNVNTLLQHRQDSSAKSSNVEIAAKDNLDNNMSFIWHLHVHKAAGTSVGHLAMRNGLTLAPYENTSHGHLDLGPDSIIGKNASEIVRRLTDLRSDGVGFGSTESWFPNSFVLAEIQSLAPWVKFMTMLRDPVQRTISSYRFHTETLNDKGGNGRCSGICTMEEFARAESNLMTRMFDGMLFGPLALHQSSNSLFQQAVHIEADKAAVERALASLSSFDVVLILERVSDPRTDVLLREKLGWTETDLGLHNAGPSDSYELPDGLNLEAMNYLDRQVYDHGVALFEG